MIPVGADEQSGGLRLLRRFSDQDLTLTDAVGLHVMHKLDIQGDEAAPRNR